MSDRVTVQVAVNGVPLSVEVEARTTLVDFLRDDLELTGTHVGCEQGVCGACTVLVDGVAARSCLMLAVQASEADVTTTEGLANDSRMAVVYDALTESHAFQCGFCTPGFLAQIATLVEASSRPDEAAVRAALSGNLCRCTGYESIIDGVLLALQQTTENES